MALIFDKLKKSEALRSLRLRIFLLILLVGLIPCIILHCGILERYYNNAVTVRTNEVQTQVKIIADHLITYGYLLDKNNEMCHHFLNLLQKSMSAHLSDHIRN